ncbi:MAG: hypothetical protein OXI27_07770 [Thaumarchaeota archaeon]|nr:hypothetical protein [Nitrososphaerota archaeon]MDE0526472.1 hypothetical protein [Nitrososphaerota archaeon]
MIKTAKQRILLMGIATVAVTGTAIAITTDVFVMDSSDTGSDTRIYNPDVTDWWGELIDSLGDETSATYTEDDWGDELWVEIEDLGGDTYRISLYGIAASGMPIEYTITETEDGYHKYGPEKEDGGMYSDTYVTSLDD